MDVDNNSALVQDHWAIKSLDSLGIRAGYVKASTFGTATGNTVTNLNTTNIAAYPQWVGGSNGGRTRRVAMGLRF